LLTYLKTKNLQTKAKTEQLAHCLLIGAILIEDLIEGAVLAKDTDKANYTKSKYILDQSLKYIWVG
jgi:hypothetical protein